MDGGIPSERETFCQFRKRFIFIGIWNNDTHKKAVESVTDGFARSD